VRKMQQLWLLHVASELTQSVTPPERSHPGIVLACRTLLPGTTEALQRHLMFAERACQVSTYPLPLGGYYADAGTSMSAPELAGCVALLIDALPGASHALL